MHHRRDEPTLVPQMNLQMGLLEGRDVQLAGAELESWKGHHSHHKKEQFLMKIQARALLLQARNFTSSQVPSILSAPCDKAVVFHFLTYVPVSRSGNEYDIKLSYHYCIVLYAISTLGRLSN